ncbi:hypothetical protein [Streptosporangium saharense]|uniref:hypothetical protein n=1 Tax=Streptosporangium saharense TaxID=1706840 RepID=UPI00341AE3EA
MGLSGWLAGLAATCPRPMVVTAPHGTRSRLLVEAELSRRGWRHAGAPAETGLLVVCGTPADALNRAVEVVWTTVPAPGELVRLRGDAPPERVAAALDEAVVRLARPRSPGTDIDGTTDVPMAERGPDRDGLTLDRLHLPLGPVLTDWPAGLVVETVLQGDVIQRARVEVAEGLGGERFWDAPWLAALEGHDVTRGEAARRLAASHLDSLGRLLAVAGWPGASARARRLRDRLLWERRNQQVGRDLLSLARAVRRSRTLGWVLRDLPSAQDPAPGGLLRRVDTWLDRTDLALRDLDDGRPLDDDQGPRGPVGGEPSRGLLAVLPELVTGADLAAARLVVAGLDPDLDQLRGGARDG